jgi:hypothetical protein
MGEAGRFSRAACIFHRGSPHSSYGTISATIITEKEQGRRQEEKQESMSDKG